jgi:integrase
MNKPGKRLFGYIRKLPSGRHQASYVGPDGKRYFGPGSYRARKDANEWLSRRQVEIQSEQWVPPSQRKSVDLIAEGATSSATLASVLEEFLATKLTKSAKPLRENTKDYYRRVARSALSTFEHVPLSSITKEQVDEWYLKRVSESKVTTASKGYKLLNMIMKWSIKQKIIDSNPCQIEGAQSATTGKPVGYPLPEEVRLIATKMPPELRFAVILGSYAGLRYGELTELRRKDVLFYFEDGREHFKLNIHRAVSYFGKSFHVGPPKSKLGIRTIEVNSGLIPELREHLNKFVDGDGESLLFSTQDGEWVRHDTFIRPWRKAVLASGLEGRALTPHSMRHFGATQMVTAGATLAELKIWLGDSSTEAVARYLHATDRNRDLANSMRFVF